MQLSRVEALNGSPVSASLSTNSSQATNNVGSLRSIVPSTLQSIRHDWCAARTLRHPLTLRYLTYNLLYHQLHIGFGPKIVHHFSSSTHQG